MSGTDMANTRSGMPGTETGSPLRYRTTRCPVLTAAMPLPGYNVQRHHAVESFRAGCTARGDR
eukprot:822243-Rhodomonas_salina.3